MSHRRGMRRDDIRLESEDFQTSSLVKKTMRKRYVRERRRTRNIPSREWCLRDYCGRTRHVSKRNSGRKPRTWKD